MAQDLDHGICILGTIVAERLVNFCTSIHRHPGRDRFEIGYLRGCAFGDRKSAIVARGAYSGQHIFDGPAAMLIAVIPVVASNWQQVDDARRY